MSVFQNYNPFGIFLSFGGPINLIINNLTILSPQGAHKEARRWLHKLSTGSPSPCYSATAFSFTAWGCAVCRPRPPQPHTPIPILPHSSYRFFVAAYKWNKLSVNKQWFVTTSLWSDITARSRAGSGNSAWARGVYFSNSAIVNTAVISTLMGIGKKPTERDRFSNLNAVKHQQYPQPHLRLHVEKVPCCPHPPCLYTSHTHCETGCFLG